MKKNLVKGIITGVLLVTSLVGCTDKQVEQGLKKIENSGKTIEQATEDARNKGVDENKISEVLDQVQDIQKQQQEQQQIESNTADSESEVVENEEPLPGDNYAGSHYEDSEPVVDDLTMRINNFDSRLLDICNGYFEGNGYYERTDGSIYFRFNITDTSVDCLNQFEGIYADLINNCIDNELQMTDFCIEVYYGGGLYSAYEDGQLIY